MRHLKHIFIGIVGGVSLLILYFVILTLANSFSHALQQFSQMWYWILILAAGFGVQVGFYSCIREKQKVSGKALVASGGVSTGSMVVCCLHHLTDVLPFLGLAAAAVFLIKYQLFFIIVGIFSNLIGITIMLEIIKKNNLMNKIKKIAILSSLVLLPIIFFLFYNQGGKEITAKMNLPVKTDSQAGITFEAKPLGFSFDEPVKFEITIDTHSGSLDFDLTKISILKDNEGSEYSPLGWQGPSPGGHHISGVLIFPKLNSEVKYIKLSIRAINQNSPLIFEWNLE